MVGLDHRQFAGATASGVLPPETDAAALIGLVMAVTQGKSTLARDGTPRASLLAIVEVALQAGHGSKLERVEGPASTNFPPILKNRDPLASGHPLHR